MNDIWQQCQRKNHTTSLQTHAWRIVEDQAASSTRRLVDTLEEHEILEKELEGNKPAAVTHSADFHSLLFTAFRYPPLKYGSRFGKKTEPSLWYGASNLSTALAEKAYYRFVFLLGSDADDETDRISKTALCTQIMTSNDIDLTQPPFEEHRALISSPTQWQVSQTLGSHMRLAKIEAFRYFSARATDIDATNLGVFALNAFSEKKPFRYINLMAFSNHHTVEFMDFEHQDRYLFRIEDFYINKQFPFPPNES